MMFVWILLLLPAATQASYEYATACIPYSSDTYQDGNHCNLMIISNSTVNIAITTALNSSSFTLPAGTVYQREFEVELHPTSGSENKAIRISSTDEIQVLLYKGNSFLKMYYDVIMVQNQERNAETDDTYITSAYNGINDDCVDTDTRHQFYLVSSFYEDTFISVRQQDGTTYELTLPEFGTFVQTTYDKNNHLASGTKITSSKPINVISGNLCVINTTPSTTSLVDAYASDVPRVESLGMEYVVPRIISEDDYMDQRPAGYSVGVVATEDNTTIVSDGDMRGPINEGETVMYEYPNKANSIYVSCSKPCLVTQYTKSIFNIYSHFMQNLLPKQQFSTSSAFFTTLNSSPQSPTSYLSLVLQGENPGDDIFLNGNSLGNLTWTPVNGYSSAELPIPEGAYELLSENGRPFAAYVYMQQEFSNAASGYALLPMGSSGMKTSSKSSIKTISVDGALPLHTVRVHMAAVTSDGQDISPRCAREHLENLKEKNSMMLTNVNEAIGKSICRESMDVVDLSNIEGISFEGNKVMLRMDHILKVEDHHIVSKVEICALEVVDYLEDLSNWQQLIFPPVTGCSRLELLSSDSSTSRTFWNGDSQQDADTLRG